MVVCKLNVIVDYLIPYVLHLCVHHAKTRQIYLFLYQNICDPYLSQQLLQLQYYLGIFAEKCHPLSLKWA